MSAETNAQPSPARRAWLPLLLIGLFALAFVTLVTVKVVAGVGLSFSDSALNPSLEDAFRRQLGVVEQARTLLGKRYEPIQDEVQRFHAATTAPERLAQMTLINGMVHDGILAGGDDSPFSQSVMQENQALGKLFFFAQE